MDKKVEMVRSFFKKEQPKNHPVKNHPLEKCEEYVKNLYIDMLCVFAMYDNDDTENQNRFIERIIYGVGDTLSIADHIKRAMEITVDKVSEFIKQIQDNDIKDIFFIDALIISCANGSPTKKQTEFLAEFADMFGLTKDNIQFLCEMVICILEQDFDKLRKCLLNYNGIEDYVKKSMCYIQPMIDNNVVSTDENIYQYSLFKTKEKIIDEKYVGKESVTLENIIIDKHIEFNSVEKVTLIGCVFSEYLNFCKVKSVVIDNCEFKLNGRSKSLYFPSCTILNIKNSFLENVSLNYAASKTEIEKCVFKNINDGNAVFCNTDRLKVEDCKFYNCNAPSIFWTYENVEEKNNDYIGCCKKFREN